MAKFYGMIGYGTTIEVRPGYYDETIEEKPYRGDILKVQRGLASAENQVLDNITVSNRISIVADAYAYEHIFAMRYVVWMGVRWKVSSVEVQRPRLILSLGEVYNGPTVATSGDSGEDSGE